MEVVNGESGETPNGRGVLYVATGARHLRETIASARSVRRWLTGVPIVLYTDQTGLPEGVFDEIRRIDNPRHSFIDKIAPLRETPFARTLFLDTDTIVCGEIDDVFDVLDRFDLALAQAPLRHDRPFVTPNCFVEMNTGVMAFKPTAEVDALFVNWLRLYEEEVAETGKMDSDQPAFRRALWASRVNFHVLPPEYNLRTVMPAAVGRCVVRIVHGRGANMDAIVGWVNKSRKIRLFLPGMFWFTRDHFEILSPLGRIATAVISAAISPWVWAESIARPWKRRLLGEDSQS